VCGDNRSSQYAWNVDEMPNAVAMTSRSGAGMNLACRTELDYRGITGIGQDGRCAYRRNRVIHHRLTAIHHILIARARDAPRRWVAMLAHAALALSLMVRMYDAYGIPDDAKASARASVDRIMSSAGISVTWTLCPCGEGVRGTEVVVRTLSSPPTNDPGLLGFSYINVEQRSGTLATVFADRVHALAQVAGADEGELLGRAMAHEIVHLLLGTHQHTESGLMRAHWTITNLSPDRPLDWSLSRKDGDAIRRALARRSPAAVLADGEPASSIPSP
jgi:hypothetical protein